MYTYASPVRIWRNHKYLIGKSVAYAYWVRWGDARESDPKFYGFRFKVLKDVEIGPHAYTLVFTDGTREELTSYDMVCIYTVDLEKS